MDRSQLIDTLNHYYRKYNQKGFIANDPISIPHRFTILQDQEIMGFFAAILAWGQRVTTINKCNELASLMDDAPYDFITHHEDADLKAMSQFRHRTFNSTDLLYFISFFKWFYSEHTSLEEAFLQDEKLGIAGMKDRFSGFHKLFFSLEFAPARTRKHIANAANNSTCKRLNMYLRWMVRFDDNGVDLGLWKRLTPAQLMCPLDVHVERSARHLGLISRKQRDWNTVDELTSNLREFDPVDPVKYDFALFGMGLENSRIPNLAQ